MSSSTTAPDAIESVSSGCECRDYPLSMMDNCRCLIDYVQVGVEEGVLFLYESIEGVGLKGGVEVALAQWNGNWS